MKNITVEKMKIAKENCGENSDCFECICYMDDDCRLNYLTDKEKDLVEGMKMEYITFTDVPLTSKESNYISQIGADLLIKTGEIPSNSKILKEIIHRAMLVKGSDVPKH